MIEPGSKVALKTPKYIPNSILLAYLGTLLLFSLLIALSVARWRHPVGSILPALVIFAVVVAITGRLAAKLYLERIVKNRLPELYEAVLTARATQNAARESALKEKAEKERIDFENSPSEVARRAEARFEEELRKGKLEPVDAPGLVLHAGEKAYWSEPASLTVHQTKTEYVGGYAGASFRVTRRLSVRSGGFHGHPVKTDTVVRSDNGSLNITDRRVVFIGSISSKDIPFSKIAAVNPFTDGIEVVPANQKTLGFITGNPHAGIVLERLINKDVATHGEDWSDLELPDSGPSSSNLKTSRSTAKLVATQIREHFALLELEYQALGTIKAEPVADALTAQEAVHWMHAKLASLNKLTMSAKALITSDFANALSTSDAEQAKIATGHWLHECDEVCYRMLDWEKDARTTRLPSPLEKVHDLMIGLTAQIFGEIKTLPDKLDRVASDTSGNAPSPIEFKFSGEGLQELAKAIADATPKS